MTVKELKEKLAQSPDQPVTFQLPEGSLVPAHFHITEVGFGKEDFYRLRRRNSGGRQVFDPSMGGKRH